MFLIHGRRHKIIPYIFLLLFATIFFYIILGVPSFAVDATTTNGLNENNYVSDINITFSKTDQTPLDFEFEADKTDYNIDINSLDTLAYFNITFSDPLPTGLAYRFLWDLDSFSSLKDMTKKQILNQCKTTFVESTEIATTFPQMAFMETNFKTGSTHTLTLFVGYPDESNELNFSSEKCDVYNFYIRKTPGVQNFSIKDTDEKELITPAYNKNAASSVLRDSFVIITQSETIKINASTASGTSWKFSINGEDKGSKITDSNGEISLTELYAESEQDVALITLKLEAGSGDNSATTVRNILVSKQDFRPIIKNDGQPSSKQVNKGKAVELMKVGIEESSAFNLSCEWEARKPGILSYHPVVSLSEDPYTLTLDTDLAGETIYRCIIRNVVDGVIFTTMSDEATVSVNLSYINDPVVVKQPGTYAQYRMTTGEYKTDYYAGESPNTIHLLVQEPEPGVEYSYQLYYNTSNSIEGATLATLKDVVAFGHGTNTFRSYNGMRCWNTALDIADHFPEGTYYFFCKIIATDVNGKCNQIEKICDPFLLSFKSNPLSLDGKGTEREPYIINSISDLEILRDAVNNGNKCAGMCFTMTKDITLPVTWEQIGVPDAHRAFYGIFDGDGHRITIEPGGRALFAFVGECTIKNLNIYGSDILGCGLVDNANTDYGEDGSYWTGCPEGPTLDKIRLLSGSRTHSSGLLVGSGSGANTMHISNCVIEKDVTVGDQGQSYIGSIVGASFNGFMDNCYSFANVIGTDTIGGLVAKKGESMGACLISNSAFIGTIDASGNRVGGILGSGYSDASAPNTPPASVVNCYVIGDISGANGVGGIFGGEFGLKVAWNPGTISNNLFYGKISSNGEDVGGIIGYYGGIDSWITITNNYYCESTGKVLPTIGKIGRIDVNTHEYSMTTEQEAAFQTGIANCDKTTAEMSDGTVLHKLNSGAYNNWIQDDLYPIIDSSKIVPQTLTVGGDYKTTYYVGDALDMTGATFTVSYSNGAKDEIAGDSTDITYSGFDSSKRGPQTVTATYGPVWTEFDVTVLLKDTGTSSDNITVYFKLLGDDKHDSDIDGKLHTLEHGGLQTWVPNRAYTVDHNATVWDLLQEVLPQYSIICGNPSGNYIEDMTYNGVTIGEFSNGPNSGWMYTLNGEHPLFGVQEQFLSDGDEIVWHYTDDWTQESGAEFLAQPDPNFSGSTKKDEKKAEKKDEGDSMAITPEDIKAAADADKGLDIVTENGTVKLSADTVKELAKGGAEVSVAVTDNGDGTRTISITAGDKPVTADVKIELASDDGKMLVIVGADGRETPVILSATDGGKLFAVVPAGAKVKAVDAQGLSFGDVKASDWFAGAVKFVTSRGIFNGTDVGFEPTAPMNRAMLVTVLQRIAGEQAKGENTFGDVKADAWYADAVIWASENGIVNGTDKGFEPDKPVTREQIATMLYRFMQHLGVDVSASKTLDGFGDGASTSPWAREAMEWAAGVGLFQGDETGKLNPGSQATRAEVATLVERLIGLMVK